MRKLYGFIMLATLLFGMAPLSVSAQGYYMPRQHARISQGLVNGSITRAEAERLFDRIARVYEIEQQAKMDGFVDEYERQLIDSERVSIASEIDELTNDRRYQDRYDDRYQFRYEDRFER
jgi:hypothetical protein